MIVVGDALVRRAWALGRGAELLVPTIVGDVASQYAFEKELAREGLDLSSFATGELESRHSAFHDQQQAAAAKTLNRLSVKVDLEAATTVTPDVRRAAHTAFVKLYEEGSIVETEQVVSTCPRCRTAVNAWDTELAEVDGECLTMKLATSSGHDIEVRLHEPELLPGVVAIAVPEGSSPIGGTVNVPIADRQVPVLGSPTHQVPAPVIAAHDAQDHEFAIVNGLTPISVLDADGTVRSTGPLDGLGRFAARAAARELLEADGVILAVEQGREEVWRCRCCATVLVAQLGRHWILRATDLEVAAADAVRDGLVAVTPPDAREAFVAGARARSDWCLSTTVGGGISVPAALCLDCGKMTVDVEVTSSCGRCMGVLVPEALFLDATFVAAIWALAFGGWPGRAGGISTAEETAVVVSAAELAAWVLPAMALGLRLAGEAPFATAVVHPWPVKPPPDDDWFDDSEADPRALRLALVGNTLDIDAAALAVAALDQSASDDVDAIQAAEAVAAGLSALDDGLPAQAAVLLASVLTAGVPAEAAERIRALTIPILGD